MNMDSSAYLISIGEHDAWAGLEESARMDAKAQVRRFLRKQFHGLEIAWNMDLSTLAFLTGRIPSSHAHTTIADSVHRSALQAWLAGLNTLMLPDQQLFVADDADVTDRCCAYHNGEWHACLDFELLSGSSPKTARPWKATVTVKNHGTSETRSIPIRIQGAWTCMVEEEHVESDGEAMPPSLRGSPETIVSLLPTPDGRKGAAKPKARSTAKRR